MRKFLLHFYTAIVLTFFTLTVTAQPDLTIQWQRTIGGNQGDKLSDAIPTGDGGYLVCGASSSSPVIGTEKEEDSRGLEDYWVIKLDSSGAIQWQTTIGGAGQDAPTKIVETTGGYLVCGSSGSDISGEKNQICRDTIPNFSYYKDCWVIKLNTNGDIIWQKTLGGVGIDGYSSFYETIGYMRNLVNYNVSAISQTSDGGSLIGTSSNSSSSFEKGENYRGYSPGFFHLGLDIFLSDYWIIKLDNMGNVQWEKTIGGELADVLATTDQTDDGGYIVGGSSASGSSYEKSGANKSGSFMTLDSFILADSSTDFHMLENMDFWVLKLDNTGNITWQRTLGGDKSDYLTSILKTDDGGYLLGGSSNSGVSGDKTENSRGGYDFWLVKIDGSGTVQWQRTIGGDSTDVLNALKPTSDGGYLAGGTSWSGISGDKTTTTAGISDYWIVKLSATGQIEWQYSLGGADELQPDLMAGLLPANDGSMLVTGSSCASISGDKSEACRGDYDYWVVKLCNNTVDTSVSVSSNTLQSNAVGMGYQWIDCNTLQAIEGATDAAYTPVSNGNYAVVVSGSCTSDTSACYSMEPVAVQELSLDDLLNIYPNPANDIIVIKTAFSVVIKQYDLTNTLGQSVINMGQLKKEGVDVSHLAPGTYFLRMITNRGTAIQKVVIER